MTRVLPPISTDEEFEALRFDAEAWLPAIRTLCARHRLSGDLTLFQQGSCVLFGVGERWVIKLFEPWFIAHHDTERRVLEHVQGALPVATPQLHGAGLLEGWGYVVMTRLVGRSLNLTWDTLDSADRARVAEEVGALTAALHALPVAGLQSLPPAWSSFLIDQRACCAARHRGQALVTESTLAEIRTLVTSIEIPTSPSVLLHTEITALNLLVDRGPDGRWRLSGLVDFEPSMLGMPEYDLAGAAIFIARGDGDLLGRMLRAYGYSDPTIDEELQRRLMAYTLLHRYSHLGFFWKQISELPVADTLDDLCRGFFPV